MPIGTFVNIIAVIIGSLIGLLLGSKFPEKIKVIAFQSLGLISLLIGMQMALKVESPLTLIFSILMGAIIGEFINLEKIFDNVGELLKQKVKSKNTRFTEGLVTAFIIFCIGSMTFVGSINEGISGDKTLLLTKSMLDGFTSIALASTFGIGVMFSVIPMLILQGGLTIFAGMFQPFFTPSLINQLTATGGILILGIGINLLDLKKIKVINMLPALLVIILLTLIFS
ncbi:MAG TPA: DUF554 domain-containing protein [Patescibacteria group bacterium]|nr:DUF554 domain-containing protein [Patescibacteria group bacterium]